MNFFKCRLLFAWLATHQIESTDSEFFPVDSDTVYTEDPKKES